MPATNFKGNITVKMIMKDELLDIVDQEDQVIGQQLRSMIYENKLSNFRVVNAFLMNSKGELWIPRRTKEKRVFPLCLDASMGGHVTSGESYQQALVRELQEELGMDLQTVSYECIGALYPHKHKTSAFMRIYLIHTDKAPHYNTKDFLEYFWLMPHKVLDRIQAGDKCKGDLPCMIKYLLLHLSKSKRF
jgi:isopentenyldiphosphate isomerase